MPSHGRGPVTRSSGWTLRLRPSRRRKKNSEGLDNPPTWVQADVFVLGSQDDSSPLRESSLDIVWEQTCLCAIDPQRRNEYFKTIDRLLKPGGHWLAVIWNHGNDDGPPFDLDPNKVDALAPNSLQRQQCQELQDPEGPRPKQFLLRYLKSPST